MDSALKRIITLIDMDCFYCHVRLHTYGHGQVELRLNPELAGKPVAVVQYNQWKQGGIIAVNYEARDRGVTRFMRGEEAKEVCPELCLASVPSVRGKADLTRYREAGVEVANVFSSFSDCVLRASIDEAFIDLTSLVEDRIKSGKVEMSIEKLSSTFVVGHSNLKGNDMEDRQKGIAQWLNSLKQNAHLYNPDYRLFVGALIVEEIRSEVFKRTGFHCSGGIAHNKILAKLVAGLHKPKCQTVLPHENVPELYETLPVKKVRNLGGKFGKLVADSLSINYMSELYNFSKEELIEKFNVKNGTWLYDIARGIDHELVTSRLIPESIGCSKNFIGPVAIKNKEKLYNWLKDMSEEVVIRLEKDLAENMRRGKLLTVSFRHGRTAGSRSCPLSVYKVESIAKDAYDILLKLNQAPSHSCVIDPPIMNLGLSASKFSCEKTSIKNFLTDKKARNASCSKGTETDECKQDVPVEASTSKKSIFSYFKSKEKEEGLQSDDNTYSVIELDQVQQSKENKIESSFFKSKLDAVETEHVSMDSECDILEPSESDHQSKSEEENLLPIIEKPQEENGKIGTVTKTLPLNSFFAKMLAQKATEAPKPEAESATLEEKTMADPPDAIASTSTVSDDEWSQVCPDCNEKIQLTVYLEHLDYHAALNLDKALNGNPIVRKTITSIPSSKSKGSPVRKKRKILKPSDQKDITAFFTSIPKKVTE